jgi:proteasome accessory factor A
MIEQGRVNARLSLEDPVAAVKTWSQDPSLQARVPMVCGRPQTALETQTQFLEAASRFVADGGCEGIVPHAREILQWWSGTLALLEKRAWPTLARRLDWVRKLELLKQAVELRPELTWTSPELKHLDHLYSSLDPQDGLYWACEREGWIEQLVDDTHIARLLHDPPDNTRAWARSALLRLATSDEIDSVGWDRLRFRIQNPARWAPDQYYTVHLPNPLTSMKTEWGPILSGAADLAEALTGLAAQYHRTNAPQAMPQANGRDLAIAAPDTEPTTGISNAAHDTPSPPHSNPENPT